MLALLACFIPLPSTSILCNMRVHHEVHSQGTSPQTAGSFLPTIANFMELLNTVSPLTLES